MNKSEKFRERLKKLPAPAKEPLFFLIVATFGLLFISRLVSPLTADKGNRYLNTVLWQILVFFIPILIYLRLQGREYYKKLRLNRLRVDHVFVIIFASAALLAGSMLITTLFGTSSEAVNNFSLYGQFVAYSDDSPVGVALLIITFALIPAACEELLFRAMLCSEFESRIGIAATVLLSSVTFALLHFNLRLIPVYLFAGAVLCLVMYVTRSAFGAFAVHFIYNACCVFFQSGFVGFYRTASNTGLLTIILIAAFLLSSAIVCFESGRLYGYYAKNDLPSDYRTGRVPLLKVPGMLGRAAWSYGALGCIAVFILAIIILGNL